MKRNMDLARQILIAMADGVEFSENSMYFPDADATDVRYHIYLLADAGLILAYGNHVSHELHKPPNRTPVCLTWAGNDFLDNARNETRWAQAKALIGKAGGASIAIWVEVLASLVKNNLGIK